MDRKQDFAYITILLSIALIIGVYLIATTVLIAKDGVFYIERAQKLSSDPIGIIKAHPPGYPCLIFMTHKFVTFFSNSSSLQIWIYSAQSVTLLCRLLALVPLYFMGKLLVGSRKSFWAILILVILPYPARFGSDALRDWPHILFLAVGFLFLLWGAKQGKWWVFGIAGLAAGLGHIIRPECAQLVIYGVLWLLTGLLMPRRNMNRPKLVFALLILLIGFAIPVAPYVKVRGKVLPKKLRKAISSSCLLQSDKVQEQDVDSRNHTYVDAGLPGNIAKAFGRLIKEISDNLMYFFVPPLLIGIYYRLCRQPVAADIERFFMSAFIVLNIIIMTLLHCNYGYISRRHCLPLVVFTIFYIPIGLHIWADWLKNVFLKVRPRTSRDSQFYFGVLLAIGITICLPKLFRPLRIDKYGYRETAQWLKENTPCEAIIATPDPRISLYAQREKIVYKNGQLPSSMDYLVRIANSEDDIPDINSNAQKKDSFWVNKKKPKKRIVIYQWKK